MLRAACVLIPLSLLTRPMVGGESTVLISGVPHVRQKPDFCGEACVEMILRKLGRSGTQDDVFDLSGVDPLEGRGCHTRELSRAIEALGFKVGNVWNKVLPSRAARDLEQEWQSLLADLRKDIPTIVCMRTSTGPEATEHFRLVLGYDSGSDQVIYHEPAEDHGEYVKMDRAQFLELWPLKYEPGKWLAIRLRLEPGELKHLPPAGTSARGPTQAPLAQHVLALKKKLPSPAFSITLARPFVVVGDEGPARVRERASSTVLWAVERLRRQYFERDPGEIIDIWLFKDRDSYEKNAVRLFGAPPTTPFGYYSAEHRALVMNISTGGGTLVHEIVHPYMRANFPTCPAWFNEGLASLYEQSADRDGRIVGLTNWRLSGLQKVLRTGRAPPFKTLLSTTDHQFYGEDPGTNYAQARYLCHYLQEKGLLESYYREFSRGARQDPTGLAALVKVLGIEESGLPAEEKAWAKYVLGLRFQ